MVVLVVGLGFAAGAGETVLLVLALIGCIVAHEFGHFITAKAAGIKVTEFFVGFGPRLWSVRRGETEYGVKAVPLGGYCRILGMNNLEEVDPADEPRTYRQAPVGRRLSVALAGSAMHFLIAIVVLFAMFFWTGDNGNYLASPSALPASNPIVEIDGLSTGASPAQLAGFHLGDRIVAVDGRHFTNWAQLSGYIQAHPGRASTSRSTARAPFCTSSRFPSTATPCSWRAQAPRPCRPRKRAPRRWVSSASDPAR